MADEAVPGVVLGQGHAAVLALEDVAAKQAKHHGGIAPAVQKQQDLFSPFQGISYCGNQGRGDDFQANAAPLLLKVDELYLRQGLWGDPPG
jgi:hypothetical protein